MTFIQHFGIENFRIFGKYNHFDFAPITILTGKNNSGKSSILKALLMLQDSFINSEPATNLVTNNSIINILRSESGNFYLGPFNRIVNAHRKSKEFLITELPIVIKGLPSICRLVLIFKKRTNSFQFNNEGHLTSLELKNGNEVLLKYSWNPESYHSADFRVFLKPDKASGKYPDDFIKINVTFLKSFFEKSYNEYAGSFPSQNRLARDTFKYKSIDPKVLDHQVFSQGGFQSFNNNYFNWLGFSKHEESEYLQLKDLLYQAITNYPELEENLGKGIRFEPSTSIRDNCIGAFSWLPADFSELSPLNSFLEKFYIDPIIQSLSKLKDEFRVITHFSFNNFHSSGFYSKTDSLGFSSIVREINTMTFNRIEIDFMKKALILFDIAEDIEIKKLSDQISELLFIKGKNKFSFNEMGFGSLQVAHLIFSVLHCSRKNFFSVGGKMFQYLPNVFLIEEPESNLHPDYQSKLADLFILATDTFNIQFIIETHSEYLIRKLQYLTANKEHEYNIKPEDTAIYYFNDPKTLKKGEKQARRIRIREDGILDGSFGPGFFDEASNLIKEIFKLSGAN